MNSRKILIVDDDESIRDTITDVLQMEDYEVVTANHGKEALDLLLQTKAEELPSLIILDMMMPVMDGSTFLKNIEGLPVELSGIPIVIASANAHLMTAEFDVSSNITRMKKPFDIDTLLEIAEKYCKKD